MDVWERQKREQELRDRLQDERNWRAREEQRKREQRQYYREEQERLDEQQRQQEARQREQARLREAEANNLRSQIETDAAKIRENQKKLKELTNESAAVSVDFSNSGGPRLGKRIDPEKGNQAVAVILCFAVAVFAFQELGRLGLEEKAVWGFGIGIAVSLYILLRTRRGKKLVDILGTFLAWAIAIGILGFLGWLAFSMAS